MPHDRMDNSGPRRHALFAALGLVLIGPVAAAIQASSDSSTEAPASQPARRSVTGRVTAKGGAALPDVVVYLESTDRNRRFDVPEPVAVSQKDAQFAPSLVVVCVGQSVDFVNDEERPIEHNVFSQSPAKPFDLGLYPPGQTKSVTFDKAGPVRLHCSIHRYMDAVVYVCPTPFHAKVAADGSYSIDNVPLGEYVLKTWQRTQRFRDKSANVTVSDGQTATLDLELSR